MQTVMQACQQNILHLMILHAFGTADANATTVLIQSSGEHIMVKMACTLTDLIQARNETPRWCSVPASNVDLCSLLPQLSGPSQHIPRALSLRLRPLYRHVKRTGSRMYMESCQARLHMPGHSAHCRCQRHTALDFLPKPERLQSCRICAHPPSRAEVVPNHLAAACFAAFE